MSLTINTNISSIVAQRNLNTATTSLNNAIERMTTGYKINHAGDNAAGYSIARNWETQLGSLDVAADNAAMASDMLSTLEDNYSLITSHLQRVRDLTEQAANGTYGDDSKTAIESEIKARLDEVTRIASNCKYNDMSLMSGAGTIRNIQVGLGSDPNSRISLEAALTAGASCTNLLGADEETTAAACKTTPTTMLDTIDDALETISTRVTKLGAAQNRIDSAIESIEVQSQNITSSLSTLRDADIAKESSKYIQAQILQQAASTLLSTANQSPSIALNLI